MFFSVQDLVIILMVRSELVETPVCIGTCGPGVFIYTSDVIQFCSSNTQALSPYHIY